MKDFLKLEDLHIDKEVSVHSLSKIVGTRILLDKATFRPDKNEIGIGTIVYIGNGDYIADGIDPNNVYTVFNNVDRTSYRVSPVRKVRSFEN